MFMKRIVLITACILLSIVFLFAPGCVKENAFSKTAKWGTVASNAQIVFMAEVKTNTLGNQGYELVEMNLDGTNRRQITDNQEEEFLPHFSPDGTRLLYTRYTSGNYGVDGSQRRVTVYDFATTTTRDLTNTGADAYPVWSPDGSMIAFLSSRNNNTALWVMNADGSNAHEVAHPLGSNYDVVWGDIAWSAQNWIMFVVGQNNGPGSNINKARIDKIRPDGTQRTMVTDGGSDQSLPGLEPSGDADPCFSPDGSIIYTSRGFPYSPLGSPGQTVRKLYAVASDAFYPGKPERNLSLPTARDGIEGVPKCSPDGKNILLFRASPGEFTGITLTDNAGTYREWIVSGFGADWNPVWKPKPIF
jgi:Tol biopolymer transport system component